MKSNPSLKTNLSNILILGRGYIGNAVYEHLRDTHNVKLVSANELDYHFSSLLGKYILNNDIQVIINCSGFTGRPNIDEAEEKKELCWELNVASPLRVNKLCDKLGIGYIHISSGCIYDGYQRDFTELDVPNFGIFSDRSSYYSKCKHIFEEISRDLRGVILRIRMPIGKDESPRNYLTKIRNYDKLIDYRNSKTYIPDLCGVISSIIDKKVYEVGRNIVNVVNHEPLSTREVCSIMWEYGKGNPNWEFVGIDKIDIKAGRSNCILDSSKVEIIYPMKNEVDAIREALS
jgi:dTDP-4-dehydrorhamnose reductase